MEEFKKQQNTEHSYEVEALISAKETLKDHSCTCNFLLTEKLLKANEE